MTSKCVGALLARNEAAPDRYLTRVLANAASFCDELVVLDDGSTDDTAKLCREAGANVFARGGDGEGWWGARARPGTSDSNVNTLVPLGECRARHELWQRAVERAGDRGWVYVFDADHELVGIEPAAFRRLLTAEHVDAWACPLFDCWNDDEHMRVDGWWQAHLRPRVWLARAYAAPIWNNRGIHSGHLPERDWHVGLFPEGAAIRHLGYVNAKHRLDKKRKYLQITQ